MSLSAIAALETDLAAIGGIVSIVSVVITVVAALLLAVCALIGWKRGSIRSLLRLTAVLLATVTALLLTLGLKSVISENLSPVIDSLLGDAIPAELIEASPTLETLINELPGALLAPILFGVLFFLCNILFLIVYEIVKKISIFEKTLIMPSQGKNPTDRAVAAVISVVCGFILIVCFIVPVTGYLGLASDALTEAASIDDLDAELSTTLNDANDNIVSPLAKNPLVAAANFLGGKALFNNVSAVQVEGGKIVWEKEIAYLFETYGTLKPILDTGLDFSKFGEDQANALRNFAGDLDHSVLIPSIAADILPAAATAWNEDKEFAGISNPTANTPEMLQPLMANTMDILATTTKDTLKTDLITVSEVLATMSESGVFTILDSNASVEELLNILKQEGLISGLISTLAENERMQVLITDVANLGLNTIGDAMNIPADDDAVYDSFVADLDNEILKIETLENDDEKLATLSSGIENVFHRYGVSATSEEAHLYAECILAMKSDASAPAEEAVPQYFSSIASALAAESVARTSADARFILSHAEVSQLVRDYVQANGTQSIANIADVSSQVAGTEKLVHGMMTMQSLLVTADSIKTMSVDDLNQQAQSIEKVMIILMNAVEFSDDGKIDVNMQKLETDALSNALCELATTRTDSEGNEVQNLATAVTNLVKSSLQTSAGIDADAANNLVEHIISKPAGEENGKDPLSSAVTLVGVIQNENTTKEEFKETVSSLISNLDKESAEVLADCISPNLLNKYASTPMKPEVSKALTQSTQHLLNNFGEHSDDLTEEQLAAETAYMQTIFELSMSSSDSQKKVLFGGESDSKLGMTADQFVDTVKDSIVISETIVEEQENLKIAMGSSMSETDKAALSEALASDTNLSADIRNALNNIFNLNLNAEDAE